jgi:NAD+ kinase
VTTILVVTHPDKPEARDTAEKLRALAGARGIDIVEQPGGSDPVDAVVALGGDGTMLRASVVALRHNVPLLGVNLGRLGFLSTVEAGRLDDALGVIASGGFETEKRMMIEATYSGRQVCALNEVAIEKAAPSRVVDISVAIGDEEVATYTADGFLVATPTGSTAYSLSAGGPVVEPEMQAMVLTPVSAHSPLWRSIVVGGGRAVKLSIAGGSATLSADGEMLGPLQPGDEVVVSPASNLLSLINLDSPRFFARLRTRFHIG